MSWRGRLFAAMVFAMTMFFVKEVIVKSYYERVPVSHFVEVHNRSVGKGTIGKPQVSILTRSVRRNKVYNAHAVLDLHCRNGLPTYTFYPEYTLSFDGSFEDASGDVVYAFLPVKFSEEMLGHTCYWLGYSEIEVRDGIKRKIPLQSNSFIIY